MTSLRALVRDTVGLIPRDRRLRWLCVLLLAVVVSLVEAGSAVMIYALLGFVVSGKNGLVLPLLGDVSEGAARGDVIVVACLVVSLLFLVRGPLFVFQSYAQARVAHNTGVEVATRLVRGYLSMPWSFHLARNSASLIQTSYTSVSVAVSTVLLPSVSIVSDGLIAVGLLAVMIASAPLVTLLTAVTIGPLIYLVMRVVRPRLGHLGAEAQQRAAENLQVLQQSLEGARDVILTGSREHFVTAFAVGRRRLARVNYLHAVLSETPRLVVETTAMIFLLGYTAIAMRGPGDLTGSLATIGVLAYAVLRVLPTVNRIGSNINNVRFGRAAIDRILGELEEMDEAAGQATGTEPIEFNDRIELVDVSFSYEGARRAAITDVNVVVERGRSLGIVGPTGSGKSTLVDLVLGLLTPTSGRVLVDGVDLRGHEARWHERIGVVSQSIYLLDDSLRRNVAFGLPDDAIDEALLEEALRVAQLDTFVAKLPEGLETPVGERGVQLSGGQRQRVAIARALYRGPDVLVFDEGTSALDNETEATLLHDLRRARGGRTVITVAHRLSTVRDCDHVVVVDEGRIVAQGAFEELASTSPIFRSMLHGSPKGVA